jgi:phage host-nuclease inhibitor protein Gam
MTRIKAQTKAPIFTLEDFQECVDTIAAQAREIQTLAAARDQSVHDIQREANTKIKAIQAAQKALLSQAETYATAHRDKLLGKKKSADTRTAIFGFRSSTRLGSNHSEGKLVALLRAKSLSNYLKLKTTLDKPAIRKALNKGHKALAALFYLTSEDTFFIEPKADRAEPDQA